MRKKLIALAIAGACVPPAAMAQTANPVTLYGRVFVTVEAVEVKGSGGSRRSRIEDQSSLFGIRGTEDLGGGLKMFFQLETALRTDQAGTTFAARNSGIGLQGGWGSFLVGRWDMPYKISTYPVEAFNDLTMGGITGVGHDRGNFDRREQNVAQYWSPSFGGFAARLAVTSNERKTATLNPRTLGGNVTYRRGPVYAFLAYEEHRDRSETISNEEGVSVGGSMNFGPVKVGAVYEEIKRDSTPSVAKRKSWLGSVVYTMGKNQFIYQHQALNTSPKCESGTLAYQYNFSKRTFFIAQYVKVENDPGATCNFGDYGANLLGIAPGQDLQGVAAGLRHLF